MSEEINQLIAQLQQPEGDDVYKASDKLAKIGSDEIVKELIILLSGLESDTRILASRTLGLIENNHEALEPLINAINHEDNVGIRGDLMMALEGFDLSNSFVEIFKWYLNGSFKVSTLAKELLDFKEFEITPRVLKKASKHWNHYANNVKKDEVFLLKKQEVEEVLNELKEFIGDDKSSE